jgi:hypothetical protein
MIDENINIEKSNIHHLGINKDLSLAFQDWLNLDLLNITWEGRYKDQFEFFWNALFVEETPKPEEVINRLNILIASAKNGPVETWFKWLKEKFIIFIFLKLDLTIMDLYKITGESISYLALILRDFLLDKNLHRETELNDFFQINYFHDKKNNISYNTIVKDLNLYKEIRGENSYEVLNSLEITLYEDWKNILKNLKRSQSIKKHSKLPTINQYKLRMPSKSLSFKFLLELCLLLSLSYVGIVGLKYANVWYEEYIAKKISLFEPNFFWLDKSLTFVDTNKKKDVKIDISLEEMEKLENIESQTIFNEELQNANRYAPESDVVLSSLESLPNDISLATKEKSEYEEIKKGGYRDYRYGRRKAYRILLKSVDPNIERDHILNLINVYNVSRVGQVSPGTLIPGGVYFNLSVPLKNLTGFMESLSEVNEVSIFESTPRADWPLNMGRVFIWIKSI